MNIALWVVQGLLAALFLLAGSMKLFAYEKYKVQGGEHAPSKGLAAFIGTSELAGAVGLVLPWATGVLPILTPIAAFALALVMILAVGHHLQHKDPFSKAVLPLVLLALSLWIGLSRV